MTTPHNMPMPDLIRVAQPAVASEWAFTNSDGGLLLVRSVAFLFTTSAAVGDRAVGLTVKVDGTVTLAAAMGGLHSAGLAVPYSAFGSGSSALASVAAITIPWRDNGVLLRQGHVLGSNTDGMLAGDQYSAIVLDVLRYKPEYPYLSQPYPTGFAIETGA